MIQDRGIAEADSYPGLLIKNYRWCPNKVALRYKKYGIWKNYTWEDCYSRVKYLSLGLQSLGLQPGEKVGTIGEEKPEDFHSCLAIQAARGVAVPLFSDANKEEVAYILNHSNCRFIVAEDQEQVDKILEIKDRLPDLEKAIYWDPKGMRAYDDPILMSFEQVIELGREYEKTHLEAFENNVSGIKGDDLCLLFYTSGTTGLPKGVMINHANIMSIARCFCEHFGIQGGDNVFNLVPAGSCFEHWFGGLHYLGRAVAHFCEKPETATRDVREISPKIILLGPSQWLSLSSAVQLRISEAGWLKKLIYGIFLPVGYKVAQFRLARVNPSVIWQALHFLGEWLAFRPVRDKIGLVHTEYPLTGGTALSPDVLMFFHALGLPIGQIYGSTEAGMVTCHGSGGIEIDTIGPPCQNVNLRISEAGEILVKSEGMLHGYYEGSNDITRAIGNSWYYSGDAGLINEDGHIIFLDRVEHLKEIKSGARYAPGYIESKLKFRPFIKEAVVLGGKDRDYLSVIITMDFESVGKWAEANRIAYTTFADLSQKDEVSAIIKRDIEMTNSTLPYESQIEKFVILNKEFDPDDAELTRTRKVRRSFIEKQHKDLTDAIYADKEEFLIEANVKYQDGKTGKVSTVLKIRSAGVKLA